VTQAPRDFNDAEVIAPYSVYVNVMAAIEKSGSAHTDNPRFHGRDRIEDPTLAAAISAIYPEAVPAGKRPTIFDPDWLRPLLTLGPY
jgi:hypothetical protein